MEDIISRSMGDVSWGYVIINNKGKQEMSFL